MRFRFRLVPVVVAVLIGITHLHGAESSAPTARERWHAALRAGFAELKRNTTAPATAETEASIRRRPERTVDPDVVVLPPFTVSAAREIPGLDATLRRDQARQAARRLSWQSGGPYVEREVGRLLIGVYSTANLPIGLRIVW